MSAGRDRRIELVEAGFAAFNRADMQAVLDLLGPEVEIRVVEPLMNAGTWRGPEGFGRMVEAWLEPWGRIDMQVARTELHGADSVLAHVHQTATGRASGVPVELDVVFLFELRGELATRLEIHPDRESALASL